MDNKDTAFIQMESLILEMTGGEYPCVTITEITLLSAKPIIAPRYLLYPETTEAQQIESAKKVYGLLT